MHRNIKKLLLAIGIGSLFTYPFIIYYTWLIVYFQGNKATILINEYGESTFEFFFIPITIILSVWTLYQLMFKITIKIKKS